MAKFITFLYGTGVLYGMNTAIDSVSPEQGPSIGGNKFIISGEGFDPRQWNDLFNTGLLDTVKWTDISSGSGSISTGPFHLQLSTGTTIGSIAGVESKALFTDAQGEIRTTFNPIIVYPNNDVSLVDYLFYIDANNYAKMSVTLSGLDKSLKLSCEVYVGGTLADNSIPLDWTTGLSVFKILRKGTTIYFIANGEVIFKSMRFVNNPATFRIYSNNLTDTLDVNGTKIEWFAYRTYAAFGEQVVHDTLVVSNNRVRGIVPPSIDDRTIEAAYAGLIDVFVAGNGSYTLNNAYEYYYLESLKVINSSQFDTKLSFINDEQVATPEGYSKGLGDGK